LSDKFSLVNADVAEHLKRLVADGDCPHLLFYGVSGRDQQVFARQRILNPHFLS